LKHWEEFFTRLIEKNTAIPTKKSEVFSTAADNQTQVGIKVYQGEREMAADNKFLGHFDLIGIPPAPRGRPQIEVTFDIDANGILNVSAKDKATAKLHQMRIQTSGGLSKAEIENMKKHAETMSKEDKKRRDLAEHKNHADSLSWQAESQLEEHKDKIDEELKTDIKNGIAKLRELRGNPDADAEVLKKASEELSKKLMKIGEKLYGGADAKEQQQQQQQQQSTDNTNENVQESEFKEKTQINLT